MGALQANYNIAIRAKSVSRSLASTFYNHTRLLYFLHHPIHAKQREVTALLCCLRLSSL